MINKHLLQELELARVEHLACRVLATVAEGLEEGGAASIDAENAIALHVHEWRLEVELGALLYVDLASGSDALATDGVIQVLASRSREGDEATARDIEQARIALHDERSLKRQLGVGTHVDFAL